MGSRCWHTSCDKSFPSTYCKQSEKARKPGSGTKGRLYSSPKSGCSWVFCVSGFRCSIFTTVCTVTNCFCGGLRCTDTCACLLGLTTYWKLQDCVHSTISQRLKVFDHVYFSLVEIESKNEGKLLPECQHERDGAWRRLKPKHTRLLTSSYLNSIMKNRSRLLNWQRNYAWWSTEITLGKASCMNDAHT